MITDCFSIGHFFVIENFFEISYYKKRSTMDVHLREKKTVAEATRARRVECRKQYSLLLAKMEVSYEK